MNPFAKRLPAFENHPIQGSCPQFTRANGFLDFSGRPEIPDITKAAGQVLVIAGPPKSGKSVFGHQCMHALSDDVSRFFIDGVSWTNGNPTNVSEEIAEKHFGKLVATLLKRGILRSETGEDLQGTLTRPELGWDLRHELLAEGLGGTSLVVRLPSVLSAGTAGNLINDIARYSFSAEYGNHVYLYEYPIVNRSEWDDLEFEIKQGSRMNIEIYEIPPHSPEDHWKFIRHRVPVGSTDPPELKVEDGRMVDVFRGSSLTLPETRSRFEMTYKRAIANGDAVIDSYALLQCVWEPPATGSAA